MRKGKLTFADYIVCAVFFAIHIWVSVNVIFCIVESFREAIMFGDVKLAIFGIFCCMIKIVHTVNFWSVFKKIPVFR